MRRALVLAIGWCVACGPPIGRLVEQRRFTEAMCGADLYSRDSQRDSARVLRALDQSARPRLHLYAVPRAELVAALGDAGARLSERAVVVRAVVGVDEIDAGEFQMSIELRSGSATVPSWYPDRDRLAGLMAEDLPTATVRTTPARRRVDRQRFSERPLLGVTAAILEASTLFMVPMTLATGHTRVQGGSTTVTEPTDEEFAAAAPNTETLARQIDALTYARYEVGQETSRIWLWPRTDATELRAQWTYSTSACAGPGPAMLERSGPEAALFTSAETIALPQGGDLESRINAVFGASMRPLHASVPPR